MEKYKELEITCPECWENHLDISEWEKTNTDDYIIYYCDVCKTGFRVKVEIIKE